MTDDNSTELVDMDLGSFEGLFYGKNTDTETTTEDNDVVDTEDDALATDEDTDAAEADDETSTEDSEDTDTETDDDSDEDDSEDEEEKPQKKEKNRKSYQERINELTKARRETERHNADLLRRLEAIEAREREDIQKEPLTEQLPQGAPSPDDTDDKGEPKYPLGEFDPDFIRDLTRFTITAETTALREKEARDAEARKVAEAQNELKTSWSAKLDTVEEEIPEIREHIADLVDTFNGLDPAYGEYLAMTIMSCDGGPLIMEYLSQNIGEAQKIVASGPAAATLAIGRLEAKLARTSDNEERRNKKKVSDAPPPPSQTTKGRKGQNGVRVDTSDLNAFEREFYKK